LGLPAYTRATSPLRRYLDLVVHQQLRLHLSRSTLLSEMEILERVGASEAVVGGINQAELLSERHWTLVYLLQHPGWQGEGVLVEKRGLRGKFILPELALETQLHLRQDLPLDSRMMLMLKDVNLAELEAYFQVLDSPSLR
jgi:exoribonuclease-2